MLEAKKGNGVNYDCKYYPCHKDLNDCTFCYCPLYPCELEERGGVWLDNKIWDCTECTWIHQVKTVESLYSCIGYYSKQYDGLQKMINEPED
jgi:precorrin-3B C17-methyltransferase